MKSVQDYIDRYSRVAQNLGYRGDSVNVLIQLLANASYFSEIENASYMVESSLEKSALLNSKIQHCVDNMYSVFRGSCPRIIMKIKPTKYLNLNPYDLIIESQNFRIYYLGYYSVTDSTSDSSGSGSSGSGSSGNNSGGGGGSVNDETTISLASNSGSTLMDISDSGVTEEVIVIDEETEEQARARWKGESHSLDELLLLDECSGKWIYSAATFKPVLEEDNKRDYQIIIGFVAPKRIGDNLTIDEVIKTNNTYYVDCFADNLSDDMYVEIGSVNNETNQVDDMSRAERTRIFAEHILSHKIFDLTLPSFGSRLYVANYYKDVNGRDSQELEGISPNARIFAQYFGYSELEDYNTSELQKVHYKGAELIAFDDVVDWNGVSHTNPFLVAETLTPFEGSIGICYKDAVPRDGLNTIHYKANRDRYVNSILRSNSDIGTVLEEAYPDIIKTGGTFYDFVAEDSTRRYSYINLYYIPKQDNVLLSTEQIEKFRKEKRAYYAITSVVDVKPGHKFVASFTINLELFKNGGEDWEQLIGKDILVSEYERKFNVSFDASTIRNIETLISKNSNVKQVSGITVSYLDGGSEVDLDYIKEHNEKDAYFEIKYSITTQVTV